MKTILSLILCFMASTLSFSQEKKYEKKLAICAVFKDDARFLSEWIDYHRVVGVEQFWLYNNNSVDNYQVVLKPYIKEGIVKLVNWPSPIHYDERWYASLSIQTSAYNHCLDKVRGKVKWLAMIGVDDYIVPVKSGSIVKVLERRFKKVSGLGVNWVLFGSAGVQELAPGDLMTEKMTRRAPFFFGNPLVYKNIVKPHHVKSCISPHSCEYRKHHWAVDTHKHEIKGDFTDNLYTDRLKIHHYWSRDLKYLNGVKRLKYQSWGVYLADLYTAASLLNFHQDTEMHRFTGKVKSLRACSNGTCVLNVLKDTWASIEGREAAEDVQPEPQDLGPFQNHMNDYVVDDESDSARDKPWWVFFFPEWFYGPYNEDSPEGFDWTVYGPEHGGDNSPASEGETGG